MYTVDGQYYGAPLNPNIYIDDNLAGIGCGAIQVDPGWHSVYVDETVWDPYSNSYAHLWYMSDNLNNGDYRWIDSDYEIIAWYLPE
jgi:hypothetical protein